MTRLLAPRFLALHLLAVVAVVATVLLGLWQYGVWHDGRNDKAEERINAAPVPLRSAMSPDEAFPAAAVGQPVELSGRWLPKSTLYVEDRPSHGRTGVWAVTPVAVCAASGDGCAKAPAMLVVRGWAPSPGKAPAPPRGAVRVRGWLQPGEGSGDTDPDPSDDVIPEMRVADAIQHVDQDLYGGYVIARTAVSTGRASLAGLVAVTPASLPQATAFTSLRNLLYAMEWWVFGGFAVYVWLRWCRDELAEARGVPSTT